MRKIITEIGMVLFVMVFMSQSILAGTNSQEEINRLESYCEKIDQLVYSGDEQTRLGLAAQSHVKRAGQGIFALDIIDFNNDGKEELFYAYFDNQYNYVVELWGYDNQLYKIGTIKDGLRAHNDISLVKQGNSIYIYISNGKDRVPGIEEQREDVLYGVGNKKLIVKEALSVSKGKYTVKKNEKTTILSRAEYYKRVKQIEAATVEPVLITQTTEFKYGRTVEETSKKIGEITHRLMKINHSINLVINDTLIEEGNKPIQVEGKTWIPLSIVSEQLGINTDYKLEDQSIQLSKNEVTAIVTQEDSIISVDGTTMVPARVIAEKFGIPIAWDQKTATLLINSDSARLEQVLNLISPEEAVQLADDKTRHFRIPELIIRYKKMVNVDFYGLEGWDGFNFNPYRVQGREMYLLSGYVDDLEMDGSVYVDRQNGKVYFLGGDWVELE